MLSVIGLGFYSASVANIDTFDYLIYNNKPITFNENKQKTRLTEQCETIIQRLLTVNHLQASQVNLVLLDEYLNQQRSFFSADLESSGFAFARSKTVYSLVEALKLSQQLSANTGLPVLILSVNQAQHDGASGLLVCDHQVISSVAALAACHIYADIDDAVARCTENLTDNISDFVAENKLPVSQIESLVIKQSTAARASAHQQACLGAFEFLSTTALNSKQDKSTLLTSIDNIARCSENFSTVLSLLTSVLCLDQHYRLASSLTFPDQQGSLPARWQNSVFYCLEQATSYLFAKGFDRRHLIISHINDNSQQLLLLSKGKTTQVNNGFLAQHDNKPILFKARTIEYLLQLLAQASLVNPTIKFTEFCVQQNEQAKEIKGSVYCVVLIADSFVCLNEQIKLAKAGIENAAENKQAWKTPQGSYFSGNMVDFEQSNKPLSFVFPGVGALYVGMGKDLLRLFPDAYQKLSEISDDLAFSLQDKLMTPRQLTKLDPSQEVHNEQRLRSELANIAEAGVSYACLLSHIFQQIFAVQPTSAAGYSMGEISMFAALGCWQKPQAMSQRLRQSPIFTEQLSGSLKRLDDLSLPEHCKHWESYHLKATVSEVEAVLDYYSEVFITIINTAQSLVIAGIPEQCLALAKRLKVRAIALNVPNIIHCELAKSEYENMKALYSLPVNKVNAYKLYSSSCYLPVPNTEKAIAVSISKCLTEQVDFPRLIKKMAATGESVFMEIGAGKSLSTWIDKILSDNVTPVTCLSVNQKNTDDYKAILKTVASLISLGFSINLAPFFSGTLIRPVNKQSESVSVF